MRENEEDTKGWEVEETNNINKKKRKGKKGKTSCPQARQTRVGLVPRARHPPPFRITRTEHVISTLIGRSLFREPNKALEQVSLWE